jgi:hypothetical protein
MERLWNKARKGLKVGFTGAMKAVGLKKEDNLDFAKREERLKEMKRGVAALLASLRKYCEDANKLAESSETIDRFLKEPEARPSAVKEITANLNQKLQELCINPLQEFLDRVAVLNVVKKKRFRNSVLLEGAADAELAKRSEKYNKYHGAYSSGVDKMEEKYKLLIAQVFAAHHHHMQEYVRALTENLESAVPALPESGFQ